MERLIIFDKNNYLSVQVAHWEPYVHQISMENDQFIENETVTYLRYIDRWFIFHLERDRAITSHS